METYLCNEGRHRRRWRGGCFFVSRCGSTVFWVVLFSVGTIWLPLRFSFLLSSVSLPFFICSVFGKKAFGLCFRIPLLWTNTMMVRVLEPGVGWTQAFSGSLLCFCSGSASVFTLVFLCFSGFFLPCFCLRSSLPASVFFPGSWPVRPSLFSGFFLWVLFEFCLNSGTKPKLGLALCFLSFVHSAGSFSPWFLLPPVFFFGSVPLFSPKIPPVCMDYLWLL